MKRLPSVTQVLGVWSDFGAVKPEVLERAAARGTEVHRICAAMAQGLPIYSVPAECAGYILSFERWLPKVERVVLAEVEFCDPGLGFMGHPDLLLQMTGDSCLSLVDLKTPASKSPLWRAQLAAYWHLAEANGHKVGRAFSLRLRQDGGLPIADEYTGTIWNDLGGFIHALNAYRYFNN